MQETNPFEEQLPVFFEDDDSYTGCTLLHKMIAEGDRKGILENKRFLTKKALNGFSSCRRGDRWWKNISPMYMIVYWQGDYWSEVVELMAKNGADVNHVATCLATYSKEGMLEQAAKRDDKKIVKILLENGADPNAIGQRSPLMTAVWNDDIIELLLQHGADPTIQSKPFLGGYSYQSPLQLAKRYRDINNVYSLYNKYGFE